MKKINYLLALLIVAALASCDRGDEPNNTPDATQVAYVVNYGSYTGAKGEISIYDVDQGTIVHGAYKSANGVDFVSNIQSMAIHNNLAYLMSNNGDKIDAVGANNLVASSNPISDGITKPRYFAATGSFAYISCWGEVGASEWTTMPNSYIAKVDLATKSVSKIPLPGGPEGVIIVNNKLYVGLCTVNKVAVVDLATNAVSYIEVSALPQHFAVDFSGNLWVSVVSTYSVPFGEDKLGLEVIDTRNGTVTARTGFPGIGSNGYLHISPDKKTLYAMGSEAYPGTKTTIYRVNAETRAIDASALISGEAFSGFDINPENGDIYVLVSPDAVAPGKMLVYDKNGVKLDEETTGIYPMQVVFHNIPK